MSRKVGVVFNPEQVLRYVEEPEAVRSHEQLVRDYLEVSIDIFSEQLIFIEVVPCIRWRARASTSGSQTELSYRSDTRVK